MQHQRRPCAQGVIQQESERGQEALLSRTEPVERGEDAARPRSDPHRFAHDRLDLVSFGHEVDDAGRNDDRLMAPVAERHRGRIRAYQGQASSQPGVLHHPGAQIDAIAPESLPPQLLDNQPLTGTDDQYGLANVAENQTHALNVQIVVFDTPMMRCQRVPVVRHRVPLPRAPSHTPPRTPRPGRPASALRSCRAPHPALRAAGPSRRPYPPARWAGAPGG